MKPNVQFFRSISQIYFCFFADHLWWQEDFLLSIESFSMSLDFMIQECLSGVENNMNFPSK